MTATHAAPSAALTPEEREYIRRGANLCRERPAVFAQLVRELDQALAAGHDPAKVRAAEMAALDRLGY